MYDPMQGGPHGGPNILNALAQPTMGRGHGAVPDWRDAWQAARPVQGDMSRMDWRNALMGWRGMKQQYRFGMAPGQVPPPVQPTTPVETPPMSVPINGQLPINPYGG